MDIIKFYIFVIAQFITLLFSTQKDELPLQLVLVKNVQNEIVVEQLSVSDSKSLNIINKDLVSILIPASGNKPEQYFPINDNYAILKASVEKGIFSLQAFDKNNNLIQNL